MGDIYYAAGYIRFLPGKSSLAIPLFSTEKSNRLFVTETSDCLVFTCFHECINDDFLVEYFLPSNIRSNSYSVGECVPIVFILDEEVIFLDSLLSVEGFNTFYPARKSSVVIDIVRSILRRAEANRKISASGVGGFEAQLQRALDGADNDGFEKIDFDSLTENLVELTDHTKSELRAKITPLLDKAINRAFKQADDKLILFLLTQISYSKLWELEALRHILYKFMIEFLSKEKFLAWSVHAPQHFNIFNELLPEGLFAYHEQQPNSNDRSVAKAVDVLHHLLDTDVSVAKAQCFFYLSGILFGTRALPLQLEKYVSAASARLVIYLEDAVSRNMEGNARSHHTFFTKILQEFKSLRFLCESATRHVFVDNRLGLSEQTYKFLLSQR